MQVLTASGRTVVLENTPMEQSFQINLNKLPPGAYWMRIRFAEFAVDRLILHQ